MPVKRLKKVHTSYSISEDKFCKGGNEHDDIYFGCITQKSITAPAVMLFIYVFVFDKS